MTDVLHLQSRAYPLHYGLPEPAALAAVESISVPGRGELRPVVAELGSLAYNPETAVHLDLTELVGRAVTLPGADIVCCHARILAAGAVLVTYALRHEADLRGLPLLELDAFDARTNDALREADAPILREVLAAAVDGGLMRGLTLRPDLALGSGRTSVDRRSVRYNCHFVTEDPPWQSDPRLPSYEAGSACRILLSYTYAWDRHPATPVAELLTMTEPTDIAVAQQSLLVGALVGGRRILVDLARATPRSTDVHAFRRFLDGVWADYHRLDGYRIESAQGPRAIYLAVREVIGVDDTHERADKLLGYVRDSLQAATAQRTEELDARLNRVAAALATTAAASFALDVAGYLTPDVSLPVRLGVVCSVVGLMASGLMWLIASIRPRRLRRRRGRRPRTPE
jgi:hypothetical protein